MLHHGDGRRRPSDGQKDVEPVSGQAQVAYSTRAQVLWSDRRTYLTLNARHFVPAAAFVAVSVIDARTR
jgi:hypothetical protein